MKTKTKPTTKAGSKSRRVIARFTTAESARTGKPVKQVIEDLIRSQMN
jgi:hypothetical protein